MIVIALFIDTHANCGSSAGLPSIVDGKSYLKATSPPTFAELSSYSKLYGAD